MSISLTAIKQSAARKIAGAKFKFIEKAPTIAVTVGAIGLVGAGVYACYKTTKLQSILNEEDSQLAAIQAACDELPDEKYSPEDAKRDSQIIKNQTYAKIGKNYAIPTVIAIGCLILIFKGHGVQVKRTKEAVAALGIVTKCFKQYRENVKTIAGEDLDQLAYCGYTSDKYTTEINDKTGEELKKAVIDPKKRCDYRRDFSCSTSYADCHEYNEDFLETAQVELNNLLRNRGYVFLNDAYKRLGLKPVYPIGALVGWLSTDNPHCEGDGAIQFTVLSERTTKDGKPFLGKMMNPIIDFNCDGVIIDKIHYTKADVAMAAKVKSDMAKDALNKIINDVKDIHKDGNLKDNRITREVDEELKNK